ncbi:MAG: cyclic pyranopterin monophosphate synthase MoaC [Archaeoglobus sp.]|jgi:cyclic pyranopterin phosphate synthase|nr:cyclic pyranopterin monophosphate synthase MoaC [Archaeoglobus sp.]
MDFSHLDGEKVRMVDISEKDDVYRTAIAEGFIRLKKETIEAIKKREIAKGNVITIANIAGVMAVKKTAELIPLCHQIPLTSINFDFEIRDDGVRVICNVKSIGKTGVEMEALTGVSIALLTIWDMVKSIEKDEAGNYPWTQIEKIRVVKKSKEQI